MVSAAGFTAAAVAAADAFVAKFNNNKNINFLIIAT